jgi:hypothetical protein
MDRLQDEVFRACLWKVENSAPCRVFGCCSHLGNGWEWSAFRDNDTVLKVPAGVFPETSELRYLANTAHNYSIIKRHVEEAFVAETQFSETCPSIRQPFLKPIPATILFNDCDAAKWRRLAGQLLRLLDAEEWLPDLGIRIHEEGFQVRSILADASGTPQIMDFAAYFDVFRLYRQRTKEEVKKARHVLKQIIARLR